MNDQADSWDGIGTSIGNRTERRANPDHPLNFFRARSEKGNYMLVLKGENLAISNKLPVLAGVDISLVEGNGSLNELRLELLDSEQKSIFRALVADVLLATQDVASGDDVAGAARVVMRIERWQELLKRKRNQVLSRQAIIGLYGELYFLKARILPRMSSQDSVLAWRGPHGEEQDFALGGWIVEIKTQLSTADQFLKISSEAQLDTASGPIAICHQTVASCPANTQGAHSLNEMVTEIREYLLEKGPAVVDIFEAGLIVAGYENRPEYDQESWCPMAANFFEVGEDFPRLCPSNIPQGVQSVKYRILPTACAGFARDEAWLNESLFNV